MEKYFYDTCALLNLQEQAFKEPFEISCYTLYELEEIKTSSRKDEDVKQRARNIVRLIAKHPNYCTICPASVYTNPRLHCPLGVNEMDWEIAKTAYYQRMNNQDLVFVTDDLVLSFMVENTFKIPVVSSSSLIDHPEMYKGIRVIEADDRLMEHFHDDLTVNTIGCSIGEYIVLKGADKSYLVYRWSGEQYELAHNQPLSSQEFGEIRARDEYQFAVIDSIMNNMVTAISGPAGSGKSLLSMAAAFDLIRRNKYDRVVMLVNPAKARGAINTGFYPGTSEEKLLASFVGNMLCSKLGEMYGVERLLDADKLRLICMSDIRGMEVREREILYIPECQNTTVSLLKLCLSRVCDGAKVIFEGDFTTQVDSYAYMGIDNGMRRAVDVLRGTPLFGYVELQNVWRSKLAVYIDQM